AGSAHSTDRELIKRSPRALEHRVYYREVVPYPIDLESVFLRWHPDSEGQFDAVHLLVILVIGFNRNLAIDRALGNEFFSDEQPCLSLKEPFFGATLGRRRLYAISRMIADRRLAYEGHFWIKLPELDFPVKLGFAHFRGQFSSAQFTKPALGRIERPACCPVEPARDFKLDAITQFNLSDLNLFVRSLRI